jgi:hypothetical protein
MAQRKDENGYVLPYPEADTTQVLAFTGTSAQSSTLAATSNMITLTATAACWIAIGTNPTAAKAAGSFYLPANYPVSYSVKRNTGLKIAALQDAAAGTLSIVESN